MWSVETVLTTAAVLTAVGVIAAAVRAVYKFARTIEAAIGKDDEGHSLADRMKTMEARVARVEHQVFPNGGGSLLDKVSKVDTKVTVLSAQTEIIATLLTTLVENDGGRAR
jgi:hypothetical protein